MAAGYVVLAVSLSTSLLLLWKLKSPPPARRSLDDVQIGRTLITGLKYVSGRHTLLATVAIAFVINVTVTPYVNMTPVMARDVLMVSPELMGILLSGHGMGALVGSILVASAVAIRYHGRVYIAGSMLLLAAVLSVLDFQVLRTVAGSGGNRRPRQCRVQHYADVADDVAAEGRDAWRGAGSDEPRDRWRSGRHVDHRRRGECRRRAHRSVDQRGSGYRGSLPDRHTGPIDAKADGPGRDIRLREQRLT